MVASGNEKISCKKDRAEKDSIKHNNELTPKPRTPKKLMLKNNISETYQEQTTR